MSGQPKKANPQSLKDVVKAARMDRGWSLRQAERETGIHNAHLVQIENGTIARPDHNVLWALAAGFRLDFDLLLTLAGHISAERSGRRSPYGAVAWKALTELDQEEQKAVVEYITDLRRRRNEQTHGE